MRAGDVIVKVNDQLVHDTGDFTHAVRSRSGDSVSVGVIRDKKEQNLNLTLPDRKESGDLLQEEESLEGPLIDAESEVDLSALQQEVAKLQPQMELATEDARTSVRELRKDLCGQQKIVRQQAEKVRKQARVEQRQLKRDQQKLKIELDRAARTQVRHLGAAGDPSLIGRSRWREPGWRGRPDSGPLALRRRVRCRRHGPCHLGSCREPERPPLRH